MLARPERFFADRFGLNAGTMERLLGSTLAGRVDHADLYLEYRVSEELVLEEGAVKKAARHVSQGAGIRAQSGERTGYAHTDDLALPNLEEAARQARAIADRSSESAVVAVGGTQYAGTELGMLGFVTSYHPGGANVCMADGSVRWVDRRFDERIFRGAITRAGGEDIDLEKLSP